MADSTVENLTDISGAGGLAATDLLYIFRPGGPDLDFKADPDDLVTYIEANATAFQAQDAVLDDLSALAVVADNEFIVGTGAGTYAHENPATARTSMGLGALAVLAAVDTAEITDNAVTLAKLAGGTAGNIITFDASGDPAAVATGTAAQVLTSNGAGAAPTFQAGGSGAWSVKESGTFSTASSLDIIGLTKTTKIVLTNLTASVDTTDLQVTTSTDNGSNFDVGASDYEWTRSKLTTAAVDSLGGDTADNSFQTGATMSSTSTNVSGFEFIIYDPALATKTSMRVEGTFLATQNTRSSGTRLQTSGAVDAISISPSAGGTITGSFVVLELN